MGSDILPSALRRRNSHWKPAQRVPTRLGTDGIEKPRHCMGYRRPKLSSCYCQWYDGIRGSRNDGTHHGVERWCRVNFLEINESKSVVMVIGRKASPELSFSVGGVPIAEVERQVYVGFTVTAKGQLLRNHYDVKMEQALAAGRIIWSFEQDLGDIDPARAIHLYEALVAPHLMYGCEIALDISLNALKGMQEVQDDFMRRMLALGKRSITVVLRTETGVKEIRYWRLLLALKYLRYLIACPEHMWVRRVLWDALLLEFEGARSWITDLQEVIKKLPFSCNMPILEGWLVATNIERLEKDIVKGMDSRLLETVEASSKLYLIHGRVETDERTGRSRRVARMRRPYLDLENANHRKALTRVLLSGHSMAVEIWQYAKTEIAREDRVCRYGCREVETPEHIWLQCEGSAELVEARKGLQVAVVQLCSGEELASVMELDLDVAGQMRKLLSFPHCIPELARYAYTVETVLERTPLEWK